ncbi:hypothetical protein DRJ17_00170 [Candidatus Woesearchaeota archaeon]|nr:MAG: hypothetical protein DRJ17_00170 [Candidatus Woesearchaeota archaeon]
MSKKKYYLVCGSGDFQSRSINCFGIFEPRLRRWQRRVLADYESLTTILLPLKDAKKMQTNKIVRQSAFSSTLKPFFLLHKKFSRNGPARIFAKMQVEIDKANFDSPTRTGD